MARRIIINGRFLTQPVTGVQRYAREVVQALDRLLGSDADIRSRFEFEMVAPAGTDRNLQLSCVRVRHWGALRGHMWEQVELPRVAKGDLLINLTNTGPMFLHNQVATIHDASVVSAPDGYSATFRWWYTKLHKALCRKAATVVTDSEFSLAELTKWYGLKPQRETVIPLGAEHVLRAPADRAVIERSGLAPQNYVLAAGSLNPNKNLGALGEMARQLESIGVLTVIAGGGNARVFKSADLGLPSSVKFLGYVSDAELRALYEQARCFVFPSKYEGFGLPPLEAMACGCPVVCSRAASLPEVCGDAALMVDPFDPRDIAESVLSTVRSDELARSMKQKGLLRAAGFRWEATARKWVTLLDSMQ